jgi:hypothetical protein
MRITRDRIKSIEWFISNYNKLEPGRPRREVPQKKEKTKLSNVASH